MQLQKKYLDEIIASPVLKGKIAEATDTKLSTVERWIKQNSEQLTLQIVQDTIRLHLKLNPTAVITERATAKV